MDLDELAKKYGGSPVKSGSSRFDELAQKYGGVAEEPEAAPQRKSTIGSELVRGGKQLASSIRTGVGALTGSPEEAAMAGVARGQAIGEEAGEGASLEAVKKAYQDKGLLSAAGEVVSQIPRALAGQVPQLAAMAGGAKLGAMAGTAVAPGPGTVVGGVLGAGATLLPQFFGSNIERQASEQMAKDEQVKIDRAAAGAAAAGQAAIEGAGTAFVLGKRIVKGVLGVADDAALATAKAQQAMTQAAERSLAAAAGRGVAKGAVVEMPVEIAQSVIERAQAGLDVTSPEALSEYGETAYQAGLIGGAIGGGAGPIDTAMARQGVKAKAAFDEAEAKRKAEQEAARIAAEEAQKAKPITQPVQEQVDEAELQRQKQEAAMERARAMGIGGGSEANQVLLEQARIRKEQQERAAAAAEKAAEAERQKELRAERVRIGSMQYSPDPMMNEVLRSRAMAEFEKANAPKAPEIPAFQQTKTIEETTPIAQPEDLNVLRGLDSRNAGLMSAIADRRAAEEAKAAAKEKEAETQKVQEVAKADAARADVDQRVAQVENFLMSPARKTQQETADYMAGVIPEMRKDFLSLLDEDLNQPLTPEQTQALKAQIRQRLKPDMAPEQKVGRTSFKSFLASQGMNKKDVQDIFGENAFRANQQLPGAIRADAPRLDMLAEAAVEAGFLQNEDTEALVDMIKAEFSGEEQVAVDMAGDRAEAEYEARRESELADRAAAIGLNTKGMTPDQIAARLDRIERKREEQRQRLAREVDGFADMPTAEQDRLVDVAMDQFGEPQIFDVERAEQEGLMRDEDIRKQATTGSGYNIDPEDQRIEKELTGKSMLQAADWAVNNAPNAFAKVIAEKVRNRLREFQRKGMTLEFNVVGGSTRPMVLRGARGFTKPEWGKDDKSSKFTVTLNGAAVMNNQDGYPPGVQYNTILHELLHVATRSQFVFMPNTDPLKKQMAELFNLVAARFSADAKAGTLPPVMVKYYKRMNNVLEDADELLTWGLTDKEVQAYLDDIKVGEKSVFTRLVELIRTALGLGKPYESALERLVRNSESLLDVDVDAIDAMLGQKDKQIGVKKKPAGPMTQESLFQKEGKPAKAPPTDSAAFKKWFGDSKVVDADGKPLVVYHGTKAFDEYGETEGEAIGQFAGLPNWFAEEPYTASGYAGAEGAMYPVYLSIKNPLNITSFDMNDDAEAAHALARRLGVDIDSLYLPKDAKAYNVVSSPQFVEAAQNAGYDGIKVKEGDYNTYAAFEPTQIKSATGNIGTYDPENADIRYQREAEPEAEPTKVKPTRQNIFGEPVLGTWSITVDPKMELQDGIIYKLLDKNIDVKRIVEAVKSTGKQIATQWNPYLQEELYHGRTANASQEFRDKEWLPLLQDMDKMDVTIGELEKYLLNRHAEDYNRIVAERNPDRPEMQDGGSSVKTEDARKYLAELSPDLKKKYEALAKRVDAITKGTRKLLVDTGYEKAETVKGWEEAFPNYVPLMREEGDFDYNFGSFGTGRGFDVRRDFSRSAMGSKRNVVDIIGNVIAARNNAIALTEKNRVARAVYGLALEAPNPDFWMAINPDAEKVPQDAIDELRAMGLDEEAVKYLMKEPKQRVLDPKKDQIVSRINTKLRENDYVLATRINGEKRYVFFNPKDPRSNRAATALKNLDAQDLGNALGLIAKVTRWMASVNTQFNPIFGPYNFLRDIQSAALQLSTTELAGQQKEIAANVVPSLRVIYSSLRKRRKGEQVEGELADLWKEFQREGGQTGFKDNFSRTQDRTEAVLDEMRRISEGKIKANARAVFDWLSDYNDSLENAVRLSAYKVAKEKFSKEGFSDSEAKQKAASLAKNLTVNFNRKGDVATQMGALYAFFNASMQGTARMVETLKGPTGKKIMAGGLLLGSMQAALLTAAGFDDEEPPEFIRSKNIVIPTGDGDYVAFPMPLGFHVIPGLSRILTEWTLSGFKDTARRVTDLTGLFLDAFNPIGNAGWSVQTITPTVLDPLVALGENKDWTGKPISKEDLFSLRPTPGYTRAREGANALATGVAEFLNYASGGTKYQPGVLSPTPEQIEYLVGQAFGGTGREAIKLATTIEKSITGEELPPYKIPLYGRFVGETKSSAAESNRFYKNMESLNKLDLEIKGRRQNKEPIGDFIKDNPEARLLPMANKTYTDIQKLRKRREELVKRDAPRESVQAVEKLITRKMQMLNDRVRALEESN